MSQIVNAIATGIEKALHDHYGWARCSEYSEGKRAPWYGPEYMFTIYIAQEIRRLQNPPYVDIEDYVYGVLYDSGGLRGQIPSDLRVEGKYDICLSDEQHCPYAVIEMKFAYGFHNIWSDFLRICRTLNRNSNIRRGFLAVLVPDRSINRMGLLDDRINGIKKEVRENKNFDNRKREIKIVVKCIRLGDGREYAAVVFEISNG